MGDEVLERVVKVLCRHSGNKPIASSTSLRSDLGLDSLDAIEVMWDIEKEFGIEINPSRTYDVRTVSDVVDVVSSLIAREDTK